MSKQFFEVIVIGAGPAGATVAYELAKEGIKVLLLDKECLPRYKCCAGGITARAAKLLDYDISSVVEDTIHDVVFTYRSGQYYIGHDSEDLIYTVMRNKFDLLLVARAKQYGATIHDKHKVTQIRMDSNGVEVSTTDDTYQAYFIVGADGAYSQVAKQLQIKRNVSYLAAMVTELNVPSKDADRWKGRINIDFGYIAGGFTWVFPKKNHISVGIGCHSANAVSLRRAHNEFLHSLAIANYNNVKSCSCLIPTSYSNSIFCKDRALLVGDAAGFVDPLTGEGIYYAVLGSHLAANVIKDCLIKSTGDSSRYQQDVEHMIISELNVARGLLRALALSPQLTLRIFKKDERVWRACLSLMHDRTKYAIISRKLRESNGKLRHFIGILTFLSRLKVR